MESGAAREVLVTHKLPLAFGRLKQQVIKKIQKLQLSSFFLIYGFIM